MKWFNGLGESIYGSGAHNVEMIVLHRAKFSLENDFVLWLLAAEHGLMARRKVRLSHKLSFADMLDL